MSSAGNEIASAVGALKLAEMISQTLRGEGVVRSNTDGFDVTELKDPEAAALSLTKFFRGKFEVCLTEDGVEVVFPEKAD